MSLVTSIFILFLTLHSNNLQYTALRLFLNCSNPLHLCLCMWMCGWEEFLKVFFFFFYLQLHLHFSVCRANGKDKLLACRCEHSQVSWVGMRFKQDCTFRDLKVLGPIQLWPSPLCGRWSHACCDDACLDTAEINASSIGRCSFPAGGVAAGSVTIAACFAAPALTAGQSNSLLFLTTLVHSFTLSVLALSPHLVFHSLLTDTDVCSLG